jgi:hypothetical protein
LGGAVIVMRRVETDERYMGEVPLELFQNGKFKNKEYLLMTVILIIDGIKLLGITQDERLHFCSSYILSDAKELLDSMGYTIVYKKIVGATQEFAEKEFVKSLTRLGVGDEDTVASMRSFNCFLEWIMEDLGGRERFVKTGWPSWPRLRDGVRLG